MMNDFMRPSLDTMIFNTSRAIWLFAQNPDQWDALRANSALMSSAINEVIRMESAPQGSSRVATRVSASFISGTAYL